MTVIFLLLQAAQPAQPAALPPPDIQLEIGATARRVTVVNRGRVNLELRTSLNGRGGEGNIVDVTAPPLPQGQTTLENVEVRVRAEARIPQPDDASRTEEQAQPQ